LKKVVKINKYKNLYYNNNNIYIYKIITILNKQKICYIY